VPTVLNLAAGPEMHLGDGTWQDAERGAWRDGRGKRVRKLLPPQAPWKGQQQPNLSGDLPALRLATTRVVRASAHLAHDPSSDRPRNLPAVSSAPRRQGAPQTTVVRRCSDFGP
jgi:hypothetical protein